MNHLLDLLEHYGLAFVFINVLALQAGLPVPAYPTLIVTGALARAVAVHSLAGAARDGRNRVAGCGSCVVLRPGRRIGGRVLQTLCRVSLSPDSCVRQTETIFYALGRSSLMVAKFVPGFASVATAMAGVLVRRVWRFIPADAVWRGAVVGRRRLPWATSSATRSTTCSTCCRRWARSASP